MSTAYAVGTGTTWRLAGACGGIDPELWFPERSNGAETKAAKEACAPCPVKADCLQWANQGVEFGVWGGTTYADRRRLRIKKKQGIPRVLKGCGTPAAYDRHVKKKEPIPHDCGCREANRIRQAETRKRAKAKKAAAQAAAAGEAAA